MVLSEAQAAAQCRKTLKSCQKRIAEQSAKYGADFPYIESCMENVMGQIDTAIYDMEVE